MKSRCKEMSYLPKAKNYEVKIRIKNHDLPKTRISNKTINFNLHKVRKITKINCRELSTVTSTFLKIHGFRKRERERKLIPYIDVHSFLVFHIPTVAP